MALKIAQTQYAQKNGMGIIYLGKRIVNLTDCGGCRIANKQIHKISENIDFPHQVDWVARIATMSAVTTFDELVAYVHNHPLPPFTDQPNAQFRYGGTVPYT